VSAIDPLDLPTVAALVRLRLLVEDARARADDPSEAGRHLALVALDGACEYALWLASREHALQVKERAGVPELYSVVNEALETWQVKGWPGVSQMHQARNAAQHAGVAHDANQLPIWADATIAFINSLCVVAFGIPLAEIMLADAVRDPSLRTQLRWSEEQLTVNPAQSFALSVGAFDEARSRWCAQHRSPVFAPSPAGDPPPPDLTQPLQDVEDFLEVQPFAGNPSEYTWLRRARQELDRAGWLPSEPDAQRALLFVAGWIVRWEIFDSGYPTDRWEAHREGIQPPITGDGEPPKIIGTQVEFLAEVPGRPARNVIYVALANVPRRGRSPWDVALRDALEECARQADTGGLVLDNQWYLSGTLVVHVPVDADPGIVGDVLERAVALAGERYAEQAAESGERELARQQLEIALREFIDSTQGNEPALFGAVQVVNDKWLGTFGWFALLEIRVGGRGQEELTQTQNIFGNQPAAFPRLHVRDGRLAFSISELTNELQDALRTAIADSEDQARHIREFRARQTDAFQAFASDIHRRFGRLPEP
jgi:hypothetical protein